MAQTDNRRNDASIAGDLADAVAHHQAGRLAEAELLYLQILGTNPDAADARHLLGVVAQQCGQPLRAIDNIKQALALVPDSAIYHTNIGEAYRTAGNMKLALKHGEEAIRLGPNSAECHVNLGVTYQHLGRNEDAIDQYERAIELDPYQPASYVNLANLLGTLSRPYEASSYLMEGLRLMPDTGHLNAALDPIRRAIARIESGRPASS